MKESLLDNLRKLSETDTYKAVFCDHLTGSLNRRAFELDDRPFVAVVDADSLKYLNDTYGHRWGDHLLKVISQTLTFEFDEESVYRLGGDEFAVRTDQMFALKYNLRALCALLPFFSFGVGRDIQQADTALKKNKDLRTREGLRATRGVRPPWIDQIKKWALSA